MLKVAQIRAKKCPVFFLLLYALSDVWHANVCLFHRYNEKLMKNVYKSFYKQLLQPPTFFFLSSES